MDTLSSCNLGFAVLKVSFLLKKMMQAVMKQMEKLRQKLICIVGRVDAFAMAIMVTKQNLHKSIQKTACKLMGCWANRFLIKASLL